MLIDDRRQIEVMQALSCLPFWNLSELYGERIHLTSLLGGLVSCRLTGRPPLTSFYLRWEEFPLHTTLGLRLGNMVGAYHHFLFY